LDDGDKQALFHDAPCGRYSFARTIKPRRLHEVITDGANTFPVSMNYTQSRRNFNPVRTDELTPNAGRFIYVSRQSDENNAHGHDRYNPVLAKEHARLSPDTIFRQHCYTGSGNVSILHNAFKSRNVKSVIRKTYFGWLLDILENELQKSPSQKLYVVYPSIDRIIRPADYEPTGNGTDSWNYTEDDFAIFQRFLDHFFGEQASNIMFSVIDDSPPPESRSNAIKAGQRHTGRRGGRPRKITPKDEACRLAREEGLNAGQINGYLLKEYKINTSIRTIQHWLKKAGLESRRGRPKSKHYTQT